MRKKDSTNLSLKFNWVRIKQELKDEDKNECQLMLGVVNGTAIDYLMFRCRGK